MLGRFSSLPNIRPNARARLAALSGLALLFVSGSARASSVLEFPDNGSEQLGRGGAWVARASDPLATFFNPAGLAGQDTRVTLQSNFNVHHTCFTRVRAASDTSTDPLVGADGKFPRVCNDIEPNPNPQLAATFRLSDRVGLGFALLGPSAAGDSTWPDFVGGQAAPNRYLLARRHGILAFPTLGLGVEVIPGLRLGASFQWGIADLKLASATVALNNDGQNPTNDVRANIQLKDYFVPGFTFGAIYSPHPRVDVAVWYKLSDAIRASGDVGTAANYYTTANARGDDSRVRYGDTIFSDCGTGTDTTICGNGENAKVKFPIPMEAKLGVRYHSPRAGRPEKGHRDPIADDLYDVEANLTWANNSAIDSIEVRFPTDVNGNGILPVSGIPGGSIPSSGDQKRGYRDVVGIRLGGDVNVLPDRLALRGGGFFESNAQPSRYQNIDFAAAERFGLALGATFRIRTGHAADSGALDLMVGFAHVFVADQSNTDPNAPGVSALAGTPCNPATGNQPGPTCAGGQEKYRTNWPVNLGTITNTINALNVGASYKF
jgi:long-chain fatty acid transport protein